MKKGEIMKKKWFFIFGFIALAVFFYHQYEYSGPYDAILRKENIQTEVVLNHLKKWRYHTDVWFEVVPDAVTTLFKRLGMGGWTETGHRVCAQGCAYWTENWTDGFHSVDLELEKLVVDGSEEIKFSEPRYLDIETWGKIRAQLEKRNAIPQTGTRVEICGPLRVDRPYYVFTIQPDNADEYKQIGTCEVVPKETHKALETVQKISCDEIKSYPLFKQIALLDALADGDKKPAEAEAIGKMVHCVHPEVLQALSTNGDVYLSLVAIAPAIQENLPPLKDNSKEREGNPVRNTMADLLKNWFNITI